MTDMTEIFVARKSDAQAVAALKVLAAHEAITRTLQENGQVASNDLFPIWSVKNYSGNRYGQLYQPQHDAWMALLPAWAPEARFGIILTADPIPESAFPHLILGIYRQLLMLLNVADAESIQDVTPTDESARSFLDIAFGVKKGS